MPEKVASASGPDSVSKTNEDTQSSVLASLKFLQWQPLYELEKPFQIFVNIPDHFKDQRTTNLVFEDCPVVVKDIRHRAANFTLDDHGFTYCHHETAGGDFTDRIYVEETYLPEIETLLRREVDGVQQVFFFDWRVRLSIPAIRRQYILTPFQLRKNAPEVEGTVIDLNDLTEWLRPAMHVHVGG